MQRVLPSLLSVLAALATGIVPLRADEAKPKPRPKTEYRTLDALRADEGPWADFGVQGEYAGRLDDGDEWGVQVVAAARGEGHFDAWGYPGGLPGAGFRKEEGRTEVHRGVREGDSVVFSGPRARVVWKDGALIVHDLDGERVGKLERVERKSPTLGAKPPKGAKVLYSKPEDVANWHDPGDPSKPAGVSPDGFLERGAMSKELFQSCRIHLEFRLPFAPGRGGQGRGNSGCYVQARYEVQVLDSFGLEGTDSECGGIYSVARPAQNLCLPPLAWQTYDIEFTAATFDESGKRLTPVKVSVWHNGVLIHEGQVIEKTHTTAARQKESPNPGPIYLQNHGDYVVYRNVWVAPRE